MPTSLPTPPQLPAAPWRYAGLAAALAGACLLLALWGAGLASTRSVGISHPLFLAGQAMLIGLLVTGLQDVFFLKRLAQELAAYKQQQPSSWPDALADQTFAFLPFERSLDLSGEVLSEAQRTLQHDLHARWLYAYGVGLFALPLVGVMAAFDPLGPGQLTPSPVRLTGPLLLCTIETLLVGLLAVHNLGRWSRWLEDWQHAVLSRESKTVAAREARLKAEADVAAAEAARKPAAVRQPVQPVPPAAPAPEVPIPQPVSPFKGFLQGKSPPLEPAGGADETGKNGSAAAEQEGPTSLDQILARYKDD